MLGGVLISEKSGHKVVSHCEKTFGDRPPKEDVVTTVKKAAEAFSGDAINGDPRIFKKTLARTLDTKCSMIESRPKDCRLNPEWG